MEQLQLDHVHVRMIARHVAQGMPLETCGILSGSGERVQRVSPIDNIAIDASQYFEMHPMQLLHTLKYIDAAGEELLAIYHCHPRGELIPSPTDIAHARRHLPGMVQLIVQLKDKELRMKAWRIDADAITDVPIVIGKTGAQPHLRRLSDAERLAIILAAGLSAALVILVAVTLLPAAPDLTLTVR